MWLALLPLPRVYALLRLPLVYALLTLPLAYALVYQARSSAGLFAYGGPAGGVE